MGSRIRCKECSSKPTEVGAEPIGKGVDESEGAPPRGGGRRSRKRMRRRRDKKRRRERLRNRIGKVERGVKSSNMVVKRSREN